MKRLLYLAARFASIAFYIFIVCELQLCSKSRRNSAFYLKHNMRYEFILAHCVNFYYALFHATIKIPVSSSFLLIAVSLCHKSI